MSVAIRFVVDTLVYPVDHHVVYLRSRRAEALSYTLLLCGLLLVFIDEKTFCLELLLYEALSNITCKHHVIVCQLARRSPETKILTPARLSTSPSLRNHHTLLMNPSSRERNWFSSMFVWLCSFFRAERDFTPTSFHDKPPSLPSTKSVFLHLDGTRVVERVIGVGGTGIVIDRRPYALKIPRISRPIEVDGVPVATGRLTPEEGNYDERPDLIRSIQDEKAIYRRLGDHPGIVRCFNLSSADHSIRMDFMENGDLRHYLAEKRPEKATQLSWLRSMAHTMSHIHNCRIIIADVRLDNMLLTDNLCVKLCDFGESAIMPLDWDLNGTDDLGFSIMTDIGQFGAVMFEIVTGQKCKFDLTRGPRGPGGQYTWPRRDSLPSTINIWLGHIIEKCWTHGMMSARDLAAELDKEEMGEVE